MSHLVHILLLYTTEKSAVWSLSQWVVAAYIKEEEEEVCLSLVSEKNGELRKRKKKEKKAPNCRPTSVILKVINLWSSKWLISDMET